MLVFLVDQDLLFDHLFGLEDESLLKSFDLLLHFINIRVSAFEVSATVDVEGIFEFFRKSFDFKLFFDQFRLQVEDLIFVSRNAVAFFHENLQLPFEILLFVFEKL